MECRARNIIALVGFTGIVFSVGLISGYGIFGSTVDSDDIMMNEAHIEDMIAAMNNNHDFTMKMMAEMVDDPKMRLQILGHMTENADARAQMMSMSNYDDDRDDGDDNDNDRDDGDDNDNDRDDGDDNDNDRDDGDDNDNDRDDGDDD